MSSIVRGDAIGDGVSRQKISRTQTRSEEKLCTKVAAREDILHHAQTCRLLVNSKRRSDDLPAEHAQAFSTSLKGMSGSDCVTPCTALRCVASSMPRLHRLFTSHPKENAGVTQRASFDFLYTCILSSVCTRIVVQNKNNNDRYQEAGRNIRAALALATCWLLSLMLDPSSCTIPR